MRNRTRFFNGFLSLLLSGLLTGCIGHYRYESRGNVMTTSGESSKALLYWYADEGRLWYGKSYEEVDSGLEMNICGATSKQFTPTDEDNHGLQLPSRSGDLQVADIDNGGKLVTLVEPKKLNPGSRCGQISVGGNIAASAVLDVGATPEVIILCENRRTPTRYPQIDSYGFNAITKMKVKGNVAPDTACDAP